MHIIRLKRRNPNIKQLKKRKNETFGQPRISEELESATSSRAHSPQPTAKNFQNLNLKKQAKDDSITVLSNKNKEGCSMVVMPEEQINIPSFRGPRFSTQLFDIDS